MRVIAHVDMDAFYTQGMPQVDTAISQSAVKQAVVLFGPHSFWQPHVLRLQLLRGRPYVHLASC